MRTNRILGLLAVALMTGLSGCALFNQVTLHYSRTTTIGQELIDLQRAKDTGAVSGPEYEKARKELLETAGLNAEVTVKSAHPGK